MDSCTKINEIEVIVTFLQWKLEKTNTHYPTPGLDTPNCQLSVLPSYLVKQHPL